MAESKHTPGQSKSLQYQFGARSFKEGRHANPYGKPAPLRWRRDWQAGYDSAKAATFRKD